MADEEAWKDIPGYGGKYQASTEGRIRRNYGNGKTRLLTPYHRKMSGSQRLVVKLTHEGKSRDAVVIGIVARTFLGPCPDGCVPYHVNGVQEDNGVWNIRYVGKSDLGRMTGARSGRRPVAKIDESREPVAFYSSAREAGKANFLSYQAVIDRCNGRIKKPFAADGYSYRWDDEEEDAFEKMTASRKVEKVDCSTGKVVGTYASIREAARENGVSPHAISSRCNGKLKGTMARDGYTYRWAGGGKEGGKRTYRPRGSRKVEKFDASGNVVAVYDTAAQAARENGKSYPCIVDRCNGMNCRELGRDGYGYRWKDALPAGGGKDGKEQEDAGFQGNQ